MKITTIWTMPTFSLWERAERTREWALAKLARALPNDLKYWVVVNSGVKHIEGNEVVPEVTYIDILQRMPYSRN